MKIVYVCLAGIYTDGFSYQDNLLPKFHKQIGYDVEIITSLLHYDNNGDVVYEKTKKSYLNEYGIKVTRLGYKKPLVISRRFRIYKNTEKVIQQAKPDILFVHGGCQFLDSRVIVKYAKKHPEVVIYVDNHGDFSNSAQNWISKNILHRIIWRKCAKSLEPYVRKFYGVLPARVDFLKKLYKLPSAKCELLVMGADDDLVRYAGQEEVVAKIRNKYNIQKDDFLIVTGGKIDLAKTQTLLLMDAVKNISNENVKLIVFGSVVNELKKNVNELSDGDKIQYIGWIPASVVQEYFSASDLVVFPGRHSVLWEQAVAQGKPLLVKDWPGTHHIDLGGNVDFLKNDSSDEIKNKIEFLLANPDKYNKMKEIAELKGTKEFSYREIAKRSLM